MADQELEPGLYEALLTGALDKRLAGLVAAAVAPELRKLADAEAADRLSRHLAAIVTRAIEALPEQGRAQGGASLVEKLIELLSGQSDAVEPDVDVPLDPARVLSAVLRRRPDGTPEALEAPLTPLLDTTLLTNSRGEPAVGHELRAEVHSSDSIDVVMAFVRLSGINPMLDALRRHCREGKTLRLVTTTYTNSTELARARRVGASRNRNQSLVRHRFHAAAREGLALSSKERLLHGVHRVVQPDALGDGHRTRVERAGVWSPQSRRCGENERRLRVVLGER